MSLPLIWADKINSPLLADFIAKHGAEYCLTAEEINDMRDAINQMAVIQQSTFMGTAEPADTPTGTGNRYWTAVSPGTYTNFGGVVVSANSLAVISVTAATSDIGYAFAPFSVASRFGGVMPKYWGLFVTHNTGVNLNATGGNHVFSYNGIKYDVA